MVEENYSLMSVAAFAYDKSGEAVIKTICVPQSLKYLLVLYRQGLLTPAEDKPTCSPSSKYSRSFHKAVFHEAVCTKEAGEALGSKKIRFESNCATTAQP